MSVNASLKEQLDAAQMAQFHYWAVSENAKQLRELVKVQAPRAVDPEKRTRSPKPDEVRTADESLDTLLADLIRASGRSEAGGYFHRSSVKQAFTDDPDCKMTSRNFEDLTVRLLAHGFIDHVPGYQRYDDFNGRYVAERRSGRYRATAKLLALGLELGVSAATLRDHYQKPYRPTLQRNALVIVRHSGTKAEIPQAPSTRLKQLEDEVRRINEGLDRFEFSLESHPVLWRNFSRGDLSGFDYNHEGRLYGDFQQLRQSERALIRIDGEPTVEIDIKSSQLTILYALCQQEIPDGDLYHVEGLPRAVVKAAISVMLGNGYSKISRWPPEIEEAFRSGKLLGYPLSDAKRSKLFKASDVAQKTVGARPVLHTLGPIRRDWGILQYMESNAIVATMLELIERGGFPVLPVHDSIIVPQRIQGIASACLKRNFKHIVGVEPKLETKSPDTDDEANH